MIRTMLYRKPSAATVKVTMSPWRSTREVVTVRADASIAEAVSLLADQHLKKVPVLDAGGGEVVGIVSRSAVNRLALSHHLERHRSPATV